MIPHKHFCNDCKKEWECNGYENDEGEVEDCSCIYEMLCGKCAIARYEKYEKEGTLSEHGYLSPEQQEKFVEYCIDIHHLAESATLTCMKCGKVRPLLTVSDDLPCYCEDGEDHE